MTHNLALSPNNTTMATRTIARALSPNNGVAARQIVDRVLKPASVQQQRRVDSKMSVADEIAQKNKMTADGLMDGGTSGANDDEFAHGDSKIVAAFFERYASTARIVHARVRTRTHALIAMEFRRTACQR